MLVGVSNSFGLRWSAKFGSGRHIVAISVQTYTDPEIQVDMSKDVLVFGV